MALFLAFFLCLIFTNSHLTSAAPRKLGMQTALHNTGPVYVSRLSKAEAPAPDALSAGLSVSGEETAPVGREEEIETSHHRRSIDRSVAGGGVILGGLATTFIVAIICYIRATRRRSAVEPGSPTGSDSSIQTKNGDQSS